MPRIFDNITQKLLTALKDTLAVSEHADFCVGYFNLRGWKQIDSAIETWSGGENNCCRLLIGMQQLPGEELRSAMSLLEKSEGIDKQTVIKLKRKLAEEFKNQLTYGAPTNEDEVGLRRLSDQIKSKKVIVKLYLRENLHAKLYMLYRPDAVSPIVAYIGSSNLTMPGLSGQGELNIDVVDYDACQKLSKWFDDRWNDSRCIDISDELAKIIDESWAREKQIPPYYIYIKMAYHLSQEARTGITTFNIPKDFRQKLFDYQIAAVKIAANHLNKRGGVIIGDVVGLGKTIIAAALARIFEDDQDLETLIICPKNLVKMWEDYRDQYRLRAKVLSISRTSKDLPNIRRYRLVIIDESHNLRNREGKRYHAIQEYIHVNGSKVILLTATPYNKTYMDISSQLRLFIGEEQNLGIRPEQLIREIGETEFIRRHQCSMQSIAAFEKSNFAEDWRQLMSMYLIRRTRSFIQENYADTDSLTGRKYLTFEDGTRSYFPVRIPKTLKFKIDENDPDDQYAHLYSDRVVDIINNLRLPRYGLGNYIDKKSKLSAKPAEESLLQDLSRAGQRLIGFCRTNLFKRLESSGQAFILSVKRHILRNYIFIYALENNKHLPIGTQNTDMLDTDFCDEDSDQINIFLSSSQEDDDIKEVAASEEIKDSNPESEEDYRKQAQILYNIYWKKYKKRLKWIRPELFIKGLKDALERDARALISVLRESGDWRPGKDTKLQVLINTVTKKHPLEKVLIFTQYADTADYIAKHLKESGVPNCSSVTGRSIDPTEIVWRFSPVSNNKSDRIRPEDELRIVVATDILSEGHNLQDCSIIINYDLPWAIIRLVQRAGRVDRIDQKAEKIICYSFLPAEGIERIIRLRSRIKQRLKENAEVVGTDERFFEDEVSNNKILDLYNEKSGIFDDIDDEVDLSSYAYQIWKNAVDKNPSFEKIIPKLPPVVYSTKIHKGGLKAPEGVLIFARTSQGNNCLTWVDTNGKIITQSQLEILNAAKCEIKDRAIERNDKHHELVKQGVKAILQEAKFIGGQLGRPSGVRFRVYERLKKYTEDIKSTLPESFELIMAIDDIYKFPLRQSATDILNRQMKAGITDENLANLVIDLRNEDRLCITQEEEEAKEPLILCSLGLFNPEGGNDSGV